MKKVRTLIKRIKFDTKKNIKQIESITGFKTKCANNGSLYIYTNNGIRNVEKGEIVKFVLYQDSVGLDNEYIEGDFTLKETKDGIETYICNIPERDKICIQCNGDNLHELIKLIEHDYVIKKEKDSFFYSKKSWFSDKNQLYKECKYGDYMIVNDDLYIDMRCVTEKELNDWFVVVEEE